jgi:hypothetical protein
VTERRNFRRSEPTDERISDTLMDQGYGQRSRGIAINWAAVSVVLTLAGAIVSFIVLATIQSSAISANHASETTAIATSNAAIAQLQIDEKDNAKQMVEVLVHLSSMDQTLKTILTYGVPRGGIAPASGGGNTIIQQAPAAIDGKEQHQ